MYTLNRKIIKIIVKIQVVLGNKFNMLKIIMVLYLQHSLITAWMYFSTAGLHYHRRLILGRNHYPLLSPPQFQTHWR